MTSKPNNLYKTQTSIGLYKFKKILHKILIIASLASLATQTEVSAAQQRFTEDFLYSRAHESSTAYRDTGHYSSAIPTSSRRQIRYEDPAQPEASALIKPLSSMRVSSPLPAVTLKETPYDMLLQHGSAVPILKSPSTHLQFSVDNEFYRKSVGNQLQLGTCASFAVVDCLLYLHGKTLSPAYLNVRAKSKYALDCANNGLNIGLAMTCAQEYGTVMDWIWPYQGYYSEVEEANKNISNKPQPNWDVCIPSPYSDEEEKGLVKFAFKDIRNLSLGDDKEDRAYAIRDALITFKAPIVVSVPVKWNNEWLPNTPTTGKIKTLIKPTDKIDGWHAVSICGFNDDTQELTFKNSWGTGWANGGFGTMTYKYFFHHAREAWIGTGTKLKS